jgi:tetratricopeptide (TPR) repeat protein
MKKQLLFAGLTILLSSVTFAQKKNVTDAILLMRKYNPAGEISANKKIVTDAMNFIDLAAANAETAEDLKMHLYRAQIYYCLNEMSSIESAALNRPTDATTNASWKATSIASFKKVLEDPKKTYKADAETFINMRVELLFNQGIAAYNDKKYEAAAHAFLAASEVKSYLGETFKDAEVNTSLAVNYAVEDFLAAKKYEEAIAFASDMSEAMPQNIDILISLVNINLQKGDVAATESYINKALALDPSNKQLYYVLGTSYMDKKENEKATAALQKAIEIDPNYNEALYQLGAHLYNLAVEKRNLTIEMDYKDPKTAIVEKEAMDLFKQALVPLEKYDVLNPSEKEVAIIKENYKVKFESGNFDSSKLQEAQKYEITSACSILDILYKTNMKLGNIDKAQEYKKRLEALKN